MENYRRQTDVLQLGRASDAAAAAGSVGRAHPKFPTRLATRNTDKGDEAKQRQTGERHFRFDQ